MFLTIVPALAHLLLYLIACCCACFAHARFVQLRCGGICKWHAEGLDEGDELEDRHIVMSTLYWCSTTDWQVRTGRVDASHAGNDGDAMCRVWFQRSYETNNISRATQLAANHHGDSHVTSYDVDAWDRPNFADSARCFSY